MRLGFLAAAPFFVFEDAMRIQLSEHFTFKKLIVFVLPSIIMMVFTNVYTAVDGLFVSNYVGKEALAAINRIFPIIFILGSIGMMLGSGGSALVSKTFGEGRKQTANEYFSLIVYVTIIDRKSTRLNSSHS